MRTRRHHNNEGFRQTQRGRTRGQVARIARRLGIPTHVSRCKKCGGPESAHFGPDKDWPKGVCMCGMPDSPCGCPGFESMATVAQW